MSVVDLRPSLPSARCTWPVSRSTSPCRSALPHRPSDHPSDRPSPTSALPSSVRLVSSALSSISSSRSYIIGLKCVQYLIWFCRLIRLSSLFFFFFVCLLGCPKQYRGSAMSMCSTKVVRTGNKESYVPIQKLSRDVDDYAILVRVSRFWEAYNVKNNQDLISTDMVMIDEEGSYVHGSIKGNFAHLFRDIVEDPHVMEALKLQGSVLICLILIKFLRGLSKTTSSQMLWAMFAVKEKSWIKTFTIGIGAKLRITLWGKSVDDYMTQKNTIQGSPIVGAFTSNLVKKYMNIPTLSSTTASKVYLDIPINEVATLKIKYSEMCNTNPLLVHNTIVDRDTVTAGLKSIAQILDIASHEFENGAKFYCHALIYDISNKNGWYRLEIGVKDETDVTKFIIFDKEAEKIIGQTAITLYDMQENGEEEDSQGQLPTLIGNLIGQRYVFHVKLTEYNKTTYIQSFAASKVHMESILGPLENKETSKHACTSITSTSPALEYPEGDLRDKIPQKKRRLSVNINEVTTKP